MMKHCRAAPHGTWHQETGTLVCLFTPASLWKAAVMNITLNGSESRQPRDITCWYFLVNVLKIINRRRNLRYKTIVRKQRHRHGVGQSSLWLWGPAAAAQGSAASKGQRQWKGSFSRAWTGTLLQSVPSGWDCKSQEGGKGKEEGISVHFWKSYKFSTLIHSDVLCFVLSWAALLWGK